MQGDELTEPRTAGLARPVPRRLRGRGALLAFAVSLGLALAVPASAESPLVFSPPVQLGGPEAGEVGMAADAQGRTTLVWREPSADGKSSLLQTARLAPGGPLGPALTLASSGCCARLAVDSAGRAAVAWLETVSGTERVRALRLDVNGLPVGPAVTLSSAGEQAGIPVLAADSQGRVTVAWRVGASPRRIESVRLLPDGSSEAPRVLSEPGVDSSGPRIAIDSQDRVHIAWASSSDLQLVRLGSDGSPGSVETVVPKGDLSLTNLVVDSQGRATLGLRADSGPEVSTVRVDLDGTVGPIRALSDEGENVLGPAIAVDAEDRVVAAWGTFSGVIRTASVASDGTVSLIRLVSDPGRATEEPSLATSPNGKIVVVWAHPIVGGGLPSPEECEEMEEGSGFDPGSDAVQGAFVGPGGVPGPIMQVSPFGEGSLSPTAAVDSQGRVAVAWRDVDGKVLCPDEELTLRLSWAPWSPPGDPETKTPPPPAVAPPPAEPTATLRLNPRAQLVDRRLLLRGFCLGDRGAVCKGRVRLVAPGHGVLASGRFRFGVGKRTLRLPLSRRGRRLLIRRDRRAVRARIQGRGVKSGAVVIPPVP